MNFEKIADYLDSVTKEYGIPSVDCIITKNHQQLFRHMCGTVDADGLIPVSEDTQYLVFSMTKIQTMTAVMQLVERGVLSLADEVSKYLPAYGSLTVKEMTAGGEKVVKAKTPMLMKHLVSMQSGLDYDLQRGGISRVLAERGEQATTRELVDAMAEGSLCFQPGEHFLYSLSHDVAAAVVEVVSGMRYEEYLCKNIWEPLGMKNTFFFRRNEPVAKLAQQYIMDEQGVHTMENDCNYQLSNAYESGGAGLVSCTEDYATLADAIACGGTGRNGAVILKPETVDIMKTNLLSEQGRKDIAATMGRTGYGYGCGMQILMEPERIGASAPAGVFGWDGAAGSCTIMDKASGTSLVFLMHVRNCGPAYGIIHPRLRDFMFED